MEFPITDLLSKAESEQWILEHFHPGGLECPRCQASVADAYEFRTTKKSQLTTYRCRTCGQTYNLYSGTVFEQRHLTSQQVVLLLRGILKGEPSKTLAAELELHYATVLELRRDLQDNAQFTSAGDPTE
jgi:transposase-like protein